MTHSDAESDAGDVILDVNPSISEKQTNASKAVENSATPKYMVSSDAKRTTPIVRLPQHHTRSTKNERYATFKCTNSVLHPFAMEREYQQAVTSAKLERIFSKPFIGHMTGQHVEGVYALARDGEGLVGSGTQAGGLPGELTRLASASAEGRIHVWNVGTQRSTWAARHVDSQGEGVFVRGLAFVPRGLMSLQPDNHQLSWLLSVGDRTSGNAVLWRVDPDSDETHNPSSSIVRIFEHKRHTAAMNAVDHHRSRAIFATGNTAGQVDIWNTSAVSGSSASVQSFSWGHDSITALRWNPAHTDMLAAAAVDRSIGLYDIRLGSPLAKVLLKLRTNGICWNPMEPVYFAAANEDGNTYAFDLRYLDKPVNVFTGHVGPVLDVDWSPTGAEVLSGSLDKTLRIFDVKRGGTARDIYHTSRMQRVNCVRWSGDSHYIFSGSDEGGVRVWRAKADARAGVPLQARQQQALNYAEALKAKYRHDPEVSRLLKHRRLPKAIKSAARTEREIRAAQQRKEARRLAHSRQKKSNIEEGGEGVEPERPVNRLRSEAVIKTLH